MVGTQELNYTDSIIVKINIFGPLLKNSFLSIVLKIDNNREKENRKRKGFYLLHSLFQLHFAKCYFIFIESNICNLIQALKKKHQHIFHLNFS